MNAAWKINADGITASRDMGDGLTETRLINHIDPDELANATPADPVNPNAAILEQIAALESTVTNRRLREAALGTDNGWLANLDAQITILRNQLK